MCETTLKDGMCETTLKDGMADEQFEWRASTF
jgi:hypothetical protein